jgi:peptidoglycan/xylan/chitin deacetylase (PgdA/CDA1 family)
VAGRCRSLSGLLRLQELLHQSPMIFVYHGVVDRLANDGLEDYVVDRGTLDSHIRHLKTRREIVPLSRLLERLRSGERVDPRWVVISLDDALQNQVRTAAEVFAAHQVPWCLSVPAGLIGSGRTVWTYELRFLLNKLWGTESIPAPGSPDVLLPMRFSGERRAVAINVIKELLGRVPDSVRQGYVDHLRAAVGPRTLQDALEQDGRFVMSTWTDLRRIAQQGVELLSHGWLHRPFNTALSNAELTEETQRSRAAILENAGVRPDVFVFPNGICDLTLRDCVARAGYSNALSTSHGEINRNTDPFFLPRMDAEYPLAVLRRHMIKHSR